MTWTNFYLICFVVGFALSLLSFVAGNLRWHFPHLPHVHGGPFHGHAAPHVGKGSVHGYSTHVSPFNFVTLAAFLAWFGGAGYLLTRFSTFISLVGLGLAMVSGVIGGGIIFLFLSRFLTSEEENLDPADFEMAGVLGRVSIPIREGGTGEIIYSQAGTRRTCGARSESDVAIPKASEVMVTHYERGIAYVRLWSEMSEDQVPDSSR
jgi:membrane protein implicated in regulation of membrane protease activity